MRAPFAWLIVLSALCLPLTAQPWETLHDLTPRDQIKVQLADGTQYKGRFTTVSAAAISLETDRGSVSVESTRVRRVQVRSAARRVRRIAIAGAIGFALGLTIDQTVGTYIRNESSETTGARAVTYIAPIAIFTAIAAPFPGYRTVYRAPRK